MRIITIALLFLSCFMQKVYSNNQNFQLKTIDILSLTSTVTDDQIEVSWQISDFESDYMLIFERSDNAVNFTSLDTLYNTGLQYNTYIDSKPIPGISYYRIRCIYTLTKKECISNITYIEFKEQQSESFKILNSFPIPFSETLNTSIRCKTKMIITIKLTDQNGSLIYENSKICNQGINTIEFSEILNAGNNFYYLTISDEYSNVKTIQLVKQNTD